MEWTQPNYDTSGPAFEAAKKAFDAAEVPTEGRWAWINERKWKHRQKMERKELDRYERGMRRTRQFEIVKADAHRVVLKMRHWLKSPYAFRRGGL